MTKFSGIDAASTAGKRQRRRFAPSTGASSPTRVARRLGARRRRSALFLLAATNMVGEDTFYERAAIATPASPSLVHRVTATAPGLHRRSRPGRGSRRSGPVPAPVDAHALGRGRDGGGVRRGRWSRWPFGGRARPAAARTSRPRWSGTGWPPRVGACPWRSSAAWPTRRGASTTSGPCSRYDGISRQDPHGRRHRAHPPGAQGSRPVRSVPVPARPPSPRRRRRRPHVAAHPRRRGRAGRRARGRASGPAAPARAERPGRSRLLLGAPGGLAAGRHGRRGVGGGHPFDGCHGAPAQPAELRPGGDLRGGCGGGHRQDHRPGRGGQGAPLPVPGVGGVQARPFRRLEARPGQDPGSDDHGTSRRSTPRSS